MGLFADLDANDTPGHTGSTSDDADLDFLDLTMTATDWTGLEDPWPPEAEKHMQITAADEASHADPSSSRSLHASEHSDTPPENMTTARLSALALSPVDGLKMDTTTTATTPDDPAKSDGDVIDEICCDDNFNKYELRPQSRSIKPQVSGTWLDQDETGDYDPTEEARKRLPRRTRVRLARHEYSSAGFGESESDGPGQTAVKREPVPLLVEAKFTCAVSRLKFKKFMRSLAVKQAPADDTVANGYGLRDRKALAQTGPAQCSEQPGNLPDLPNDLTGWPIARGCWACLGLGLRCPLLDDERAWPCSMCVDDDHDCELVTPPVYKQPCELCRRRRSACSYTYTTDHSGPCQDCERAGFRCVAGPVRDTIRPRLRYERDWKADPYIQKEPPKPKAYRTCQRCQSSGKACSLTNGATGEECTACEMAGARCVVETTTLPPSVITPQHNSSTSQSTPLGPARRTREEQDRETPTKRSKLAHNTARKAGSQETLSKSKPGRLPRANGNTRTIITKFCHPIQFNHGDTSGTEPCNFCDGTEFAFFGFEAKEVEIIDWADGQPWTEVSAGHSADGIPTTKMCETCTMHRMPTIMCQKHDMVPLQGVSPDALDKDGAVLALLSGEVRKDDNWCAVCPSLVTYGCESEGALDAFGNPSTGCGLMLCEQCTFQLIGSHDGDLQGMLTDLKDEPTDLRPLGLRADSALLKQDGPLLRHVIWSAEQ